MFLAGLGIFAGSALSVPVGCLVCFVLLWLATALRFVTEAISVIVKQIRQIEGVASTETLVALNI